MAFKSSTRHLFYSLSLGLSLGTLVSCAHAPSAPPMVHSDPISAPEPKSEMDLARDQISKLQEKVQDLETRLSALNDKINLENGVSPVQTSLPTEAVSAPAAHGHVVPNTKPLEKKPTVKKEITHTNPKVSASKSTAFASNESVDRFREAKILFDSKRYSDAVVEFSDFIKNEPDHSLAPGAQYYLGMSYFHQNEYKLAEEELSRVLLSYAHSSYIPDTLIALSKVSTLLKKESRAAYFKEKLLSQFPNSPQAKSLNQSHAVAAPESKMPETKAPEMKAAPMEEPKVIEGPKAPEAPILQETEHS